MRTGHHSDPFLTRLYDRLHDTPTQRKFRRIAPFPVGVVFQEWPGMTLTDMRREFRQMRRLGFTCLKQCLVRPGTDLRRVMHAALDEGILPWWYDEGGWAAITPALLRRLRISPRTPIADIRMHPRFRAHQEQVLRRRIDRGEAPDRGGAADMKVPGVALVPSHELEPDFIPHFVAWARRRYRSVAAALAAFRHTSLRAAGGTGLPRGWSEFEPWLRETKPVFPAAVLRCKADLHLAYLQARTREWRTHDSDAPFRAGGEMGLFLPFAARGTDMEGIADVMADAGSFYPSIHLAWHFEEVDFEVTRPVFMMAQLVQDWFKGGWAAAWESTGGAQVFAGGKAPFWPPVRERVAGFTVNAGVMTQLMLSYLAGGFKGFGFWCWSAPGPFGEFSVLDRQRQPGERAVRIGRIGRAAHQLRDELWQARKEPLVGVFTDFTADIAWALRAVQGRDLFKHVPMQARVGISRALINANVPWEYVTASDLRAGLAARYRTIYLPALLAFAPDLQRILLRFVRSGGRLVLDMPGAWTDDRVRRLDTGPGTLFERTFGCCIRDYQYASNVPWRLNGETLTGCIAELGLTHARARALFGNGLPAIAEARTGRGSAVVLAYEAALHCFRPGSDAAERRLVEAVLGGLESPYACHGAIVYRLAAPTADHYFLVNDGPACRVALDTKALRYVRFEDVVDGGTLTPGQPIALPPYSGRWLRAVKTSHETRTRQPSSRTGVLR